MTELLNISFIKFYFWFSIKPESFYVFRMFESLKLFNPTLQRNLFREEDIQLIHCHLFRHFSTKLKPTAKYPTWLTFFALVIAIASKSILFKNSKAIESRRMLILCNIRSHLSLLMSIVYNLLKLIAIHYASVNILNASKKARKNTL